MVTTAELRGLLLAEMCTPDIADGPSGIEWWRDVEGKVKAFKHMVKDVLGRCTCCGEVDKGPSAACNARHENKDCNCFGKPVT